MYQLKTGAILEGVPPSLLLLHAFMSIASAISAIPLDLLVNLEPVNPEPLEPLNPWTLNP
jgi:hypothetical protein